MTNTKTGIPSYSIWSLGILIILMGLAACAQHRQKSEATHSGFLGDYSKLEKGDGDWGILYYINPDIDFGVYKKGIVNPVQVWVADDRDIDEIPKEEVENLEHYLYAAMIKELERNNLDVVDEPGENTARFRLALTEATESTVPLDIVTTYIPPARLITEAVNLASGTYLFVGSASIEFEIVDSLTGERLAAACDRREATKNYEASLRTWGDVKKACDFWAEEIGSKFQELRAGKGPLK